MSGGGGCELSRRAAAAARRAPYLRPRRSSVLPPAGPARPSSFAPPTILPAPVPLTHILSSFVGHSAPLMLDMCGVCTIVFYRLFILAATQTNKHTVNGYMRRRACVSVTSGHVESHCRPMKQ